MSPKVELENALDRVVKVLTPVADGFVVIARVGDENGKTDSFRYKVRGPTSESRGLVETLRTYLDEDDRLAYRESFK